MPFETYYRCGTCGGTLEVEEDVEYCGNCNSMRPFGTDTITVMENAHVAAFKIGRATEYYCKKCWEILWPLSLSRKKCLKCGNKLSIEVIKKSTVFVPPKIAWVDNVSWPKQVVSPKEPLKPEGAFLTTLYCEQIDIDTPHD